MIPKGNRKANMMISFDSVVTYSLPVCIKSYEISILKRGGGGVRNISSVFKGL